MPGEVHTMKFGLNAGTIAKINAIFSGWPDVKQVIIYGSRAKGNYRNGSDIDLTLVGDAITQSQMLKIANELDDLLLPYKIDLSLLRQIEDNDLIEHIKRVGMVFYERAAGAKKNTVAP